MREPSPALQAFFRRHHRVASGAIPWAMAIAGALAVSATASAGGGESFPGVNVDVQAFSFTPLPRPGTAYGAASGRSGFWNSVVNFLNITSQLDDLDGIPTGIAATVVTSNANGSECVSGPVSTDWSALMCDYAFDGAGVVNPVTIELENVPPGAYSVFVYACFPGQDFSPGRVVSVQAEGDPADTELIGGPVLFQQFAEGLTHTIHSITVDAGDIVTISSFDNSGEFGDSVVINGFQLIPAPDPIAEITAPDTFNCICDDGTIAGIASASAGTFESYVLEWSATGADPWFPIGSGDAPVGPPAGPLGVWDTEGLAEGFYFLRLTVEAVGKAPQTAVNVVYVDQTFDSLTETSLAGSPIVGGNACIAGTVNDQCFGFYTVEYRAIGDPGFVPVDSANPIYVTNVINQTYATWDTVALGIADGGYEVRVTAITTCGNEAQLSRFVSVDNTPPQVGITAPVGCAYTGCGPIEIVGTVIDENLDAWSLQYANTNGGWTTIASGSDDRFNEVLGVLDPTEVGSCATTLRLVARDAAVLNCNGAFANRAETLVTINTSLAGDLNADGVVDALDLGILLGNFNIACP